MSVRRWCRSLIGALALVGVAAAPLAVGVIGAPPAGAAPNGFTLLLTTGPSETCQLAGVDLATGVVTPTSTPASLGACASDLAETADGRVFGIVQAVGQTTVQLLRYDPTTGAPTVVGQVGTFNAQLGEPGVAGGLTFDKNGNLFVEMVGAPTGGDPNCPFTSGSPGSLSVCLYRVDPTNPANATFLGLGPSNALLEFLTAACDGRAMTLNGTSPRRGSTSLLPQAGQSQADGPINAQEVMANEVLTSRDLSNGASSAIGTGVGATNILTGIAFDSGGTLWGIGGTGTVLPVTTFNVFTVNTTTGLATVGPTLSGEGEGIPVGLALPLSCATPPVVIPTAAFTG